MASLTKPKRALLAYCALADRLHQSGGGPIEALTPFFATVCTSLAGELFDASKFSTAVADRYGLYIPRLASLGLADHLERRGLLEVVSGHATSTVYRFKAVPESDLDNGVVAVSEQEIDQVLGQFVERCREDPLTADLDDLRLQTEFLERLLHADSMRLLTRREGRTGAKQSAGTLILSSPVINEVERLNLRLDYQVAQFLLDLRQHSPSLFDRVSDIAFANMAAEALSCFSEPAGGKDDLKDMVVYLDSPLLLDVLGVNVDYAEYGRELLAMVEASGATTAVMDDCIAEAESVIAAQLAAARSGLARRTSHWGTSAKTHILSALKDNVGARTISLGIAVHKDPDIALFRRSIGTVGDIQAEMTRRMQSWPNDEARHHDERSVWSMLKIRDASAPCFRICDSKALLIARNTALVKIANDAWRVWLKGFGRHGQTVSERWSPVAMSDKQLAGYLWLRSGTGNGQVSKARLLAHCSAAIRPRPDVKARAYNLALQLEGKTEADHLAALLEDREGERALMRAVRADPEDVTPGRMPYIIEQVRLAAGEFAAATVRAESAEALEAVHTAHEAEVLRLKSDAAVALIESSAKVADMKTVLLQTQLDAQGLTSRAEALEARLTAQEQDSLRRDVETLDAIFRVSAGAYCRMRWLLVGLFSATVLWVTTSSTEWDPIFQILSTFAITAAGFWFVPEFLERPSKWYARKELRTAATRARLSRSFPASEPDFKSRVWEDLEAIRRQLAAA